ncbi:MAG: histidine triad nucleotide-binding protein [Candidatus Kerfeldbacteria bacterium]
MECLFCRIASGAVPSNKVFEDDHLVAFSDIRPVAPLHILLVPRKHIASVAELTEIDEQLVGEMVLRARQIAEQQGIATKGYRLVFNVRSHGGQVVDHIHLHIIGGKKLGAMA